MTLQEMAARVRAMIERSIPLAEQKAARARRQKLTTAQIDQALDRINAEVRSLRAQHKLGVVRSARLLLELQRQLLEAGYAPDLVRKMILSMMLQLFSAKK